MQRALLFLNSKDSTFGEARNWKSSSTVGEERNWKMSRQKQHRKQSWKGRVVKVWKNRFGFLHGSSALDVQLVSNLCSECAFFSLLESS